MTNEFTYAGIWWKYPHRTKHSSLLFGEARNRREVRQLMPHSSYDNTCMIVATSRNNVKREDSVVLMKGLKGL